MNGEMNRVFLDFILEHLHSELMVANVIAIISAVTTAILKLKPIILKIIEMFFQR